MEIIAVKLLFNIVPKEQVNLCTKSCTNATLHQTGIRFSDYMIALSETLIYVFLIYIILYIWILNEIILNLSKINI